MTAPRLSSTESNKTNKLTEEEIIVFLFFLLVIGFLFGLVLGNIVGEERTHGEIKKMNATLTNKTVEIEMLTEILDNSIISERRAREEIKNKTVELEQVTAQLRIAQAYIYRHKKNYNLANRFDEFTEVVEEVFDDFLRGLKHMFQVYIRFCKAIAEAFIFL